MERPKPSLLQHLKALIRRALNGTPITEERLRPAGLHHCGRVGRGKARNPNPRKRELEKRRHAKRAAKARR